METSQGCGAHLSKANEICTVCEESNNDSIKEGNFFISLSLEHQIREILQREGLTECTNKPAILDYKPGDVSLLWNCNGVPLFLNPQTPFGPFSVSSMNCPLRYGCDVMLESGLARANRTWPHFHINLLTT